MEKICFMLVSWILPVLWDYHWLRPLHLMLTEINYSVFKFLFTVLCSINLSFYFCGVRWRHISYQVLLSQPELWKTISLLSPSQCKYNLIIICFRAVLKLSPIEVYIMKLMDALMISRAWFTLARHRFQLGGINPSGQLSISSTRKNSVQFKMTLGMWQMRNTATMQMRMVARFNSPLTALLVAFWWVYLEQSI